MFSQTRTRAAWSVPESTSSSVISWSARSRRSSDIADLLFRRRSCFAQELRLAIHFDLKPVPDAVQPDGHVVLFDLEHPGQLFVRQPLDVTQQEQAGVVGVHGGDGTPEPLLEE